MQHLSILNVSIRGQNKLVNDLGQKVFSFQNKLTLCIRNLKSNNFTFLEKIEVCFIESEVKINYNNYVGRYLNLNFYLPTSKNDFET